MIAVLMLLLAAPAQLLALGDSLAASGDLDGAEAAYAAADDAGAASAALAHNRGIAALAAGRVGEAVAHLLRARRLAPDDPSVLRSLAAARTQAGVAATPESPAWRIARIAARPAGVGGLAALAAVAGVAAVLARRRRPGALALAGVAALAWGLAAAAWLDAAPRGTVLAETPVRSAPAAGAAALATITPGRTVRLGVAHGDWRRVGRVGWASVEAVDSGR